MKRFSFCILLICGFALIKPAMAEEEGALETYNRSMFTFNTAFDDYIMKPIAKGYRAVTNEFVRERVRNFFSNLKEPATMINHTLQGNLADTGKSGGRFLVNTTLGLLGTFDVASGWGIAKNKTGLDETLAKWCVPDGPFIVLPFIGPSTPRAAVGYAGDSVANPLYWSEEYIHFELLDKLTMDSVDPYSTIKSAYMQNRLKMHVCGTKAKTGQTPSYDFDFDEDFDDE